MQCPACGWEAGWAQYCQRCGTGLGGAAWEAEAGVEKTIPASYVNPGASADVGGSW